MTSRFSSLTLTADEIAFLDGFLDMFDELPDGAYQAACVAAIGSEKRFKGRDPHEVWLAWWKEGKS